MTKADLIEKMAKDADIAKAAIRNVLDLEEGGEERQKPSDWRSYQD